LADVLKMADIFPLLKQNGHLKKQIQSIFINYDVLRNNHFYAFFRVKIWPDSMSFVTKWPFG
jgi:hypothetical protein